MEIITRKKIEKKSKGKKDNVKYAGKKIRNVLRESN